MGRCLFQGSQCRGSELRSWLVVRTLVFAASLLKPFRIKLVIRTMCTDEPGPTASFTVALQPPETTGQDYKSSQEDEPPLLLLLWPLAWSVWLTHSEETWCRGTLPQCFQNTLCCLFWGNLKASWKISSSYFSCGIVLPCLAFLQSQKKSSSPPGVTHDLHFFYKLDAIPFASHILISHQIFLLNAITLMLFLILREAFQMFWFYLHGGVRPVFNVPQSMKAADAMVHDLGCWFYLHVFPLLQRLMNH